MNWIDACKKAGVSPKIDGERKVSHLPAHTNFKQSEPETQSSDEQPDLETSLNILEHILADQLSQKPPKQRIKERQPRIKR